MESLTKQTDKKDEKISKIIDHVLRQVFGEEAAYLIYLHLEKKYEVKKDEVADRIDLFARGLEDFLRSGAYVVERKILDDIYSSYGLLRRLELARTQDEGDFVTQVRSIMRRA
jgi:hypothetical protein